MFALSMFLVSICPVSAMSGNTDACTYDTTHAAPTVGVFYSEVCEDVRGVVRCEREDYIVSYVEIGADDPIAGLDDRGTM